jgi:hypothetical protein
MQADYAALIEKHHLDGLRMIRNAGDHAKHLLQVAPDAADAYLVLGVANYVSGSQPVHKRLTELVAEFPQNPLFVGELAKLMVTRQP